MPSHPTVVTPTSPSNPVSATGNSNANLTRTPPRSSYTGTRLFASPSPKTSLPRGEHTSPGSKNTYPSAPSQYNQYQSVNTSDITPAASSPTYPNRHISSAVHQRQASHSVFPADSLPRTSSLLPPARIIVDSAAEETRATFRDPFDASAPPLSAIEPGRSLEPRPDRGHLRSSSTGGLSDSFRNLNRWSASTTSSRASNLTNFTRRVSVGVEAIGAAFGSPSRKLQKNRPSTAGGSPRSILPTRVRHESPAPAPIPPLQTLPQISTGPSLEEQVRVSAVLDRDPSPTPVLRRNYIRRSSDDPGFYWDGPALAEEEKPGLLPPASATTEALFPAASVAPHTTMPYTQNGETRGHSRSRSTGGKGGADTTSSAKSRDGARERDRDRDRDRDRERKTRPKAMLSKALQKAQTAVQLDNAQNVEGARRAYAEACSLLHQVLLQTTSEEDRRKLEAIDQTYTSRIAELDATLSALDTEDDKVLPQRPDSDDFQGMMSSPIGSYGTSPRTNTVSSKFARERETPRDSQSIPSYSVPISTSRRHIASRATPDLSIETSNDPRDGNATYLGEQYSLQSSFSRPRYDNGLTLQPLMENSYMPPPLSPRRPLSPAKPPEPESPDRGVMRSDFSFSAPNRLAPTPDLRSHQRGNSHGSVSWLDPIDESGGSTASSVHSRSSSLNIRRKHIRAASGDTEAEFDAALDDAIEAAYDDGYEPENEYNTGMYGEDPDAAMAKTFRRVELARERVRESEREALVLASEREKRLRLQQQLEDEEYRRQEGLAGGESEGFYDGNDTDEDERLLEEMTRGYAIEDFAFGSGPPTRSGIPRESDSSGVTSRTWHSSMGSNPPTSTTVLTTVTEDTVISDPPTKQPTGPLPPPPTQALPQIPPQPNPAGSEAATQSVRSRRLSGQNPKQLKIETTKLSESAPPATAAPAYPVSRPGGYIVQQRQALSAGPNRTNNHFPSRPTPSPVPGVGPYGGDGSGTPPLPSAVTQDDQPRPGSPSVSRPALRKNFSASSLKSMKSRNLSVSNIDDASELSPGTPLSNQFGIGGSSTRLPALPHLPTPIAASFKERMMQGSSTGGLHLFDSEFHSPNSPGSPNPLMPDGPAPLEPCPNDVMLRPFWLMRCLYQTICHPRGGYLSNKLFVPRDVWRVKNVKLKNVEDKIANCDYLTAALQKLARVDTCDADAVLDEMQALEGILEQVQASLSRKLGSEVGVQGANTMFKDASVADNEAAAMPRSASVAGTKGSSFSWRRLRSKNSSANLTSLATSYGGKGGSGGASTATTPVDGASTSKDVLLPSLPMTSHPTSRPTKRDVSTVQFGGPNANYMSSLARLFDAAQAIDQIARQVEDPGLRHADKTQVGLELCTRHAAEFFGFYICRFVLSDLAMMLDKFVKRGSEWVLT